MSNKNEGYIKQAYTEMLKSTSELIFFKDMDLKYQIVSDSFVDLIGFDSYCDVLNKDSYELFQDETVADRFTARDRLVLEGVNHQETYFEFIPRKNGRQAYIYAKKTLLYNEDGEPIGIFCIGEEKTKEYDAKVSFNIELQSLFGMSSDGLMAFIFDLTSWRILDSNYRSDVQRFCYNLKTIDDYKKMAINTLVEHPSVNKVFVGFEQDNLRRLYDEGKREFNMEYMVQFPQDKTKWVRFTARTLVDPLSDHLIMVIKVFDIDSQKTINGELLKAAEQDLMTGLLNHDYTMKYISQYLIDEGKTNTSVLLMIDVDNFKGVNDNYGHQIGDGVLVNIAKIIKHTFRSNDIIGRVGGDEFMVLMKNCGSIAAAQHKVPELSEALEFTYSSGKSNVDITCSIGISIFEADGKTFDQLYYEADAALYRAKASGKNKFAYADSINTEAEEPGEISLEINSNASAIHLKTLLENMDGSMVLCSVANDKVKITYVSPSIFRVMKRTPEEIGINGNRILDIIYEEDKPKLKASVLEGAASNTTINEFFRVHTTDDSGVAWWHARGSAIKDDESPSEEQQLLFVITDVTNLMKYK